MPSTEEELRAIFGEIATIITLDDAVPTKLERQEATERFRHLSRQTRTAAESAIQAGKAENLLRVSTHGMNEPGSIGLAANFILETLAHYLREEGQQPSFALAFFKHFDELVQQTFADLEKTVVKEERAEDDSGSEQSVT